MEASRSFFSNFSAEVPAVEGAVVSKKRSTDHRPTVHCTTLLTDEMGVKKQKDDVIEHVATQNMNHLVWGLEERARVITDYATFAKKRDDQ